MEPSSLSATSISLQMLCYISFLTSHTLIIYSVVHDYVEWLMPNCKHFSLSCPGPLQMLQTVVRNTAQTIHVFLIEDVTLEDWSYYLPAVILWKTNNLQSRRKNNLLYSSVFFNQWVHSWILSRALAASLHAASLHRILFPSPFPKSSWEGCYWERLLILMVVWWISLLHASQGMWLFHRDSYSLGTARMMWKQLFS